MTKLEQMAKEWRAPGINCLCGHGEWCCYCSSDGRQMSERAFAAGFKAARKPCADEAVEWEGDQRAHDRLMRIGDEEA